MNWHHGVPIKLYIQKLFAKTGNEQRQAFIFGLRVNIVCLLQPQTINKTIKLQFAAVLNSVIKGLLMASYKLLTEGSLNLELRTICAVIYHTGKQTKVQVVLKCSKIRNSLEVQWLRLCDVTAERPGSVPGWGTKIP